MASLQTLGQIVDYMAGQLGATAAPASAPAAPSIDLQALLLDVVYTDVLAQGIADWLVARHNYRTTQVQRRPSFADALNEIIEIPKCGRIDPQILGFVG